MKFIAQSLILLTLLSVVEADVLETCADTTCSGDGRRCVVPSGRVLQGPWIDVEPFVSIAVNMCATVYLGPATRSRLWIDTDSNFLPFIEHSVLSGQLTLGLKPGNFLKCQLKESDDKCIKITVDTAQLSEIVVRDGSSLPARVLTLDNYFEHTNDFGVHLSGSGSIDFVANATNVTATLTDTNALANVVFRNPANLTYDNFDATLDNALGFSGLLVEDLYADKAAFTCATGNLIARRGYVQKATLTVLSSSLLVSMNELAVENLQVDLSESFGGLDTFRMADARKSIIFNIHADARGSLDRQETHAEHVHLSLENASDMECAFHFYNNSQTVSVDHAGGRNVTLSGATEMANLRLLNGVGGFLAASNLRSQVAMALIDDNVAKDIAMLVDQELFADIRGSGNIYLSGGSAVNRTGVGSGQVIRFVEPLQVNTTTTTTTKTTTVAATRVWKAISKSASLPLSSMIIVLIALLPSSTATMLRLAQTEN